MMGQLLLSNCSSAVLEVPTDRNGGVKLVGYNNRITVDNTLDERMKLLEEQVRPRCFRVTHNLSCILSNRCYRKSGLRSLVLTHRESA